MGRTRVLLADDHRLLMEACRKLLEPHFQIVGIVTDGRAPLGSVVELKPDDFASGNEHNTGAGFRPRPEMKGQTMNSCLRIASVVLLALIPAWAGSTKYVSIYRNPAAGPGEFSGKRVAAFVVLPEQTMREGREETLASELRERGLDCLAGYTVLPGALVKDQEKAKEFLKKANISGAVLIRLLGDEEKTSYSPGTVWYSQSYYPTFWGYWNYGWSAVYVPGYQWTDRVITLETLIYSIDKDALLWAGRSESTNPKDIRKFVKDLVSAAGKEMRKAGLVKK